MATETKTATKPKRERAKAKPSKAYVYGCQEPNGNLDLALSQFWEAHKFRNDLCRVELVRREAVENVLRTLRPDLAPLAERVAEADAAVQEARAEQKRRNAEKRSRKTPTDDQRASIRELSQTLSDLRRRLREARKEAFAATDVREALDRTSQESFDAAKGRYNASPCFWGTKLLVMAAAKSMGKGAPPHFQRWNDQHSHAIMVQLQGGLSPADAFLGRSGQFQAAHTGLSRGGRRQFATAYLRVASEGRAPVFVEVPFVYHRPMPPDARIKEMRLQRSRVGICGDRGYRHRWDLIAILSREKEWQHPDCAAEGEVGIDLGWRVRGDGSLRVASWTGTDGQHGELSLPASRVEEWRKPDELRSIRDEMFNEARSRLTEWLRDREGVPGWLWERTQTLAQWRSPQRLAGVVIFWAQNRFAGDEEVFRYLDGWPVTDADVKRCFAGWRRQDAHLLNWETRRRQHLQRWRRDFYRNFAAKLRRQYRTAKVEDTDWRDLAALPEVEEADTENRTARSNQRIAAVGMLAGIIRQSFAVTLDVEAAYTTQTCARCFKLDPFDAAAEVYRICQHCGVGMDQDRRAALHILNGTAVKPGESGSG